MLRMRVVENVAPDGTPWLLVRVRRKGKKRKKGSKRLRGLERAVDQLADAGSTFSSEYRARHRRSNRKKKDGWLRDLDKNLPRSARKARKKIKPKKVFRI